MPLFGVVLDTTVLYPGSLRSILLRLISRESQVLKNPPQTVQQILDRLRKHTPKFVAEIENYLAQTERRFLKP
jgi:hypothetical protein